MLQMTSQRSIALVVALATGFSLVLSGCSHAGRRHNSMAGLGGHTRIEGPDGKIHELTGMASWYGERFHGRKTASGEVYDMHAMTAAHKTLPFGTMVRVTDIESRKTVIVRITDRGPFTKGRVIDLSYAAAGELDMIQAGVVPVRVDIVQWAGSGTS
jgi:rare lipoprotein A (peptidoglycan hydrolase)